MKLTTKEITYQECWEEILSNNNNNHDKASAVMIEIITNGSCAVWDGEKIDRMKEEIISKFPKERKTDETAN